MSATVERSGPLTKVSRRRDTGRDGAVSVGAARTELALSRGYRVVITLLCEPPPVRSNGGNQSLTTTSPHKPVRWLTLHCRASSGGGRASAAWQSGSRTVPEANPRITEENSC